MAPTQEPTKGRWYSPSFPFQGAQRQCETTGADSGRKLMLALVTELEHDVVQDIPHRRCCGDGGVFEDDCLVDDLVTEPD